MKFCRIKFLIFIILFSFQELKAQQELKQPNLRFNLSEDTSSYAGLLMVNQVWTRYISNNPDKNGIGQPDDFDIGLRRSRLIFYTYLMDKVFIYTQIGSDGIDFRSPGNPQISLYNAQTEYIISKDKLHIGFGLHTWNGVSRYNNCKLLEYLVVDNPGYTFPVGGTFDRLGRQFGIYAKGTLDKLHYRASISKPFEYGTATGTANKTSEYLNNKLAYKAYLDWQFFDTENQLFPYMTMNNLGRAKLFNVGAGFYYHPESMIGVWNGKTEINDIFLFAVDAFLDMPLRNGGAVTSYLGYYDYSFGKDYLVASGKMNVSTMAAEMAIAQGRGNSEWETGTGQIVRAELGYLFSWKMLNSGIQPFGAFSYKNFEALDEASIQFDAGLNMLNYGHNIKWTFQYSSRPIYNQLNGKTKVADSRGQLILQTQVYF